MCNSLSNTQGGEFKKYIQELTEKHKYRKKGDVYFGKEKQNIHKFCNRR